MQHRHVRSWPKPHLTRPGWPMRLPRLRPSLLHDQLPATSWSPSPRYSQADGCALRQRDGRTPWSRSCCLPLAPPQTRTNHSRRRWPSAKFRPPSHSLTRRRFGYAGHAHDDAPRGRAIPDKKRFESIEKQSPLLAAGQTDPPAAAFAHVANILPVETGPRLYPFPRPTQGRNQRSQSLPCRLYRTRR
jgi:hypothetical protein